MTPDDAAAAAVAALSRFTYRFDRESALQGGLALAFEAAGIAFEREVDLGAAGRIDFVLPEGRLGVEVKIRETPNAMTRQLWRYAGDDAIGGLLLVTTSPRLVDQPATLRKKPVRTHLIRIL